MGLFNRFKKETERKEKQSASVQKSVQKDVAVPAIHEERKGSGSAWNILSHPIVSEKAAALGALNQYVFAVHPDATKQQIRQAVEEAYGTRPNHVNVVTVSGKWVRSGRVLGKTKQWKKAIVTLPRGKTIQVYEGV